MLKKLLFSFLFIGVGICAFAQPKSFSKKPEVFIVELKDFMSSTKEAQAIEAFTKFEKYWKTNKFLEDHQLLIIKVGDEMLLNKMRITPDFELYCRTLVCAKDTAKGLSDQKFDFWIKAVLTAAKAGTNQVRQLLKTSKGMFEENAVYVSESKKWFYTPTEFKYNFSGGKYLIEFNNIDLKCVTIDDKIEIKGYEMYDAKPLD